METQGTGDAGSGDSDSLRGPLASGAVSTVSEGGALLLEELSLLFFKDLRVGVSIPLFWPNCS